MKKIFFILIIGIIGIAGGNSLLGKTTNSGKNYTSYFIGSDASISLPSTFKFKGTYDEDGDGIIFSDGIATIWVENPFPENDMSGFIWWTTNEIGNGKPLLNVVKNNYFVQSGYDYDGKVYYTKAVIKYGIFYTATMKYPKSYKSRYDNMIPKIFNTFPIM